MNRIQELSEELRSVFSNKGSRLLDSLIPLVIFLIAYQFLALTIALMASLLSAAAFAIYRLLKKEPLKYAFGGLGGVLLAAVFVKISGSSAGFFLPGIISSAVTIILCLGTVAIKRPLVAWSSYLARGWPLDWYWHPNVLPAYNEVTIIWAIAFGIRLGIEYWFFQQGAVNSLGLLRVLLGWPYTLILLVSSYLYGQWRLSTLRGPSIEEFTTQVSAPWQGQRRGF